MRKEVKARGTETYLHSEKPNLSLTGDARRQSEITMSPCGTTPVRWPRQMVSALRALPRDQSQPKCHQDVDLRLLKPAFPNEFYKEGQSIISICRRPTSCVVFAACNKTLWLLQDEKDYDHSNPTNTRRRYDWIWELQQRIAGLALSSMSWVETEQSKPLPGYPMAEKQRP